MKKLLIVVLALLPVTLIASETIEVQGEPAVVAAREKLAFEVTLPEDAKSPVTLSFHVWMKAPRFIGYIRTLRVYWNDEELIETVGRPERFTTEDGRETIAYLPTEGWQVPYAPSPQRVRPPTRCRYLPPSLPEFDPSYYEFKIPEGSGTHRLEFEYFVPVEDYELFISNVSIRAGE